MAGLIFALAWGLVVAFVWAPLGIFLWLGFPADILTFRPPYRVTSITILTGYYVSLLFVFFQRSRVGRPLFLWGSIFLLWLIGVFGFLRGMNEIAARFSNIK